MTATSPRYSPLGTTMVSPSPAMRTASAIVPSPALDPTTIVSARSAPQ
jgi:hypothetical protein